MGCSDPADAQDGFAPPIALGWPKPTVPVPGVDAAPKAGPPDGPDVGADTVPEVVLPKLGAADEANALCPNAGAAGVVVTGEPKVGRPKPGAGDADEVPKEGWPKPEPTCEVAGCADEGVEA